MKWKDSKESRCWACGDNKTEVVTLTQTFGSERHPPMVQFEAEYTKCKECGQTWASGHQGVHHDAAIMKALRRRIIELEMRTEYLEDQLSHFQPKGAATEGDG